MDKLSRDGLNVFPREKSNGSDKVAKPAFKDYLREAQSWETSAVLKSRQSERRSHLLAAAGVMLGLLGMAAAYHQYTAPPPMPLIFEVDRATGAFYEKTTLKEGQITTSEATDKYFVQLYVQYRESWDPELSKKDRAKSDEERAQGYYYRAALMSNEEEQRRYEAFYRSEQSPLRKYGDRARAHPRIKIVTFLGRGVASVRYTLVVEREGTAVAERTDHTAIVTFAYSNGRMSERDRLINPLGFQGTYRTDPDVPEAPATPAPVMPPAPAPAPIPLAVVRAPAPLDLRPLPAGER